MEFAKNVLISVACTLRHSAVFRFAFLRSNLSCHHSKINLSNLTVPPLRVQFNCYGVAMLT
jgi:hypothetical protein